MIYDGANIAVPKRSCEWHACQTTELRTELLEIKIKHQYVQNFFI